MTFQVTLKVAAQLAEKHVRHHDVEHCHSYGEPGYSDPESGILFADWNDSPKWLINGLERRGFVLEWSDEWTIIYEADCKAYRTSPDSYGWTPSYIQVEDFCNGDAIAHEEIQKDRSLQDSYVEYLLNNPRSAAFRGFDLAAHGFTQLEPGYESGFHPGQNDRPDSVLKALQAKSPDSDFVFSLDSVGQFDCHFSAWSRPAVQEPKYYECGICGGASSPAI